MKPISSIKDKDYNDWIISLKKRYKASQIKAAICVNSELIKFNWLLGKDIVEMKADSKWGSSFFETLSRDLKREFPNTGGFSAGNLGYMKRFYLLFSDSICPQAGGEIQKHEIYPQAGDKIFNLPWGHIKLIIDKCNGRHNMAMFYIDVCLKNNWSRAVLMNQISSNLYERQGKAITMVEANIGLHVWSTS